MIYSGANVVNEYAKLSERGMNEHIHNAISSQTSASLNHQLNIANTSYAKKPTRILYPHPTNGQPDIEWQNDNSKFATYSYPNIVAASTTLYKALIQGQRVVQMFAPPQSGKGDVILHTANLHASAYPSEYKIAQWHSMLQFNTLLEQNINKTYAANLLDRVECTHLPIISGRAFGELVDMIRTCTYTYKTPFFLFADESQRSIGDDQWFNELVKACGGNLSKCDDIPSWDNPLLRICLISATPTIAYDPNFMDRVEFVVMQPGDGYTGPKDLLNRDFIDLDGKDLVASNGKVLRQLLDRSYEYYLQNPVYSHVCVRLLSADDISIAMKIIVPDWARSRGLSPNSGSEWNVYAYGDAKYYDFENPSEFLNRVSTTPRYKTSPGNPFSVHNLCQSMSEGMNVPFTSIAGWFQQTSKQSDTEGQRISRPCGYGESKRVNKCPLGGSKNMLINYISIIDSLGRGESPTHVEGNSGQHVSIRTNPHGSVPNMLVAGTTAIEVREKVARILDASRTQSKTSPLLHISGIGAGALDNTGASTTDPDHVVRMYDTITDQPDPTDDPSKVPVFNMDTVKVNPGLWKHSQLQDTVISTAYGRITFEDYLSRVEEKLPKLNKDLNGKLYFSRVPTASRERIATVKSSTAFGNR